MLLRRKARPQPEIYVASFADIAFLLIIFFILTTELNKPFGKELQIPSGVTDPAQKAKENLTVNLKPGFQIRYGEKAQEIRSLPELQEKLKSENLLARKEEDRIVILDSSPLVSYKDYYQVVMAITKAGGVLALVEYEGGDEK